jgi:5-methylcytosine-specific restriction endonuclease McrA
MLNHPVLVLNKDFIPVEVIMLEKAIKTVFSTYRSTGEPRAKILDVSDFQQWSWDDWKELKARAEESVIRSASAVHRRPDIIVLTRHHKFRKPKVNFNRRSIYHRDNNTCQYCGKKFPTSELNLDHVHPRSQGGKSTWDNVVVTCIKCNSRKGGRTPEQAGMQLLRKPVKPKITFPYKQYKCKTWEAILGELYWEVDLVSDEKES